MVSERGFDTAFWADPFVQGLPAEGKLLFAYLWTNSHCNQAGLYQVTVKTIAFETSLPEADIPGLLQMLEPKAVYYPDAELVWVKNFIKRQTKSPKFLVAAAKCLSNIKNNGAIRDLLEYNLQRYNISIPYQYSTDRVAIPPNSDSVSNSKANSGWAGVVKGEGKILPSESEIEESLPEGDREVISAWFSVRGFKMNLSDASELVARLRTEFPGLNLLQESKGWAARKLSEPLTPKSRPSSQIWNWMVKAREFAEKRKPQSQSRRMATAAELKKSWGR